MRKKIGIVVGNFYIYLKIKDSTHRGKMDFFLFVGLMEKFKHSLILFYFLKKFQFLMTKQHLEINSPSIHVQISIRI